MEAAVSISAATSWGEGPMINVRTLGTAEVLAGEHRITPDSAMLFALALFLSVSADQRVQRSRLLELFWPGGSDGSQRHALRQLLYRLRLSGFPVSLDGDDLLVAGKNVESDIQRVLLASWPDEATPAEIQIAATVLPGYDPPMPEQFREWLDELRSRVNSQYRRASLVQIDAARRDGRWHDVDEWARRCLQCDPLNEEATLAHAEAIAMTGSKTRALEIIDQYLTEIGDHQRVIGLPARVLRRRVSESAPERGRTEHDAIPLTGRALEIARLNDALMKTMSGRSAAIFMVGAAGIGKSRLAQELRTTAALRGWRTLSTQLQTSDAQRPLGVFVDLLAGLLKLPGALGCAPESLAQIRVLTEHDVAGISDGERSQEPEAVQERLRTAAVDVLESVVSEGPLAILIDDLHWCDDASVRLLQYLIARSAALPVMWTFMARPEGKYELLRDIFSDLRVETLRVDPLSADAASALFGIVADGGAVSTSGAPSELTSAVTGGNPLFVLELARHVRATGQTGSLPHSLRAVIRDRAARLSPLAQHVLHTCAVLGRYASVPRVAAVLEIGTAELLACIEELDALGIVGAGRGVEALSIHDLWRDELLSELRPAARKLLHHRCGLVLEEECRLSRSPSTVWEAAQHLLASGSEGRALSLIEGCAQHQLDNGLAADAAKCFDLAFRAATTDVDKYRGLAGKIAALKRAADWTQISSVVGLAIELARRVGDTNVHSDWELLETETLWRTEADPSGSLDRSLACALDESASIAHRAHAALLAAIVSDNLCRFDALQHINSVATRLGTVAPESRADILSVQLIYETIRGSLERANSFAQQLIALERQSKSVRGLLRALRFSCNPKRLLGEFDSAVAAAMEAIELAEHHGIVGEAASAADIAFSISLERRDLVAAKAWSERSASLAAKVGARYARAGVAYNQAIYALLRNDPADAARCLEPYAKDRLADPMIRQRMLHLSILARIFIAGTDHRGLSELAPSLRAALDVRRATGAHDYHVASYAFALEALGARGLAEDYVSDFIKFDRRDRTPPSGELLGFLTI
jgi:DNA-binding SARP family transcriptional activator